MLLTRNTDYELADIRLTQCGMWTRIEIPGAGISDWHQTVMLPVIREALHGSAATADWIDGDALAVWTQAINDHLSRWLAESPGHEVGAARPTMAGRLSGLERAMWTAVVVSLLIVLLALVLWGR